MVIWPTKKFREISDDKVKTYFFVAFDQLFKNDVFLLENEVHERSVAHKLAEYLQQQFFGWHVDCEYNRHGIDIKKLSRKCDGEYKEYVYPDIVIHHRGYDSNLLAIEIKPRKFKNIDECDNAKLIEFTEPKGKYKYQLGLFIGFNGLNKPPQIVWYKNGKQYKIIEVEPR